MPKIKFIVESDNNPSLIDPFARDTVDTNEREVSIDLLTNELYLELSDYKPVGYIRISLTTGRPFDELEKETVNEMYNVLGYILPRVERKLDESKVQGAYGLDRVQLEKLKKSLAIILAQKDDYLKEKFPSKNESDSQQIIDSDMGGMKYFGQHEGTALFCLDYRRKHTFTVRVAPTKEEGVYLLTSTAMLSGANTPHFRSERYIDITRTQIEDEIGRERGSLERATDHASKNFWG